jgi:hypothetical protein
MQRTGLGRLAFGKCQSYTASAAELVKIDRERINERKKTGVSGQCSVS